MFSNKIDKNSLISKLIRFPLGLWHKKGRTNAIELPKTTCGYFASGVLFGLMNILLIITWVSLLGIGFTEGVFFWFNEVFNWCVSFRTPVSTFCFNYLPDYIGFVVVIGLLIGLFSPFILLVGAIVLLCNKYKTEVGKGLDYIFFPLFDGIGKIGIVVGSYGSKLMSALCKPLDVKED